MIVVPPLVDSKRLSVSESVAIDSCRAVACLVVVGSHVYEAVTLDFVNPINEALSYSAVVLFFLVSGFVNYHSYSGNHSLKSFFVARCRRILPAYYVALAVGLVLSLTLGLFEWSQFYAVIFLNPLFGTVPTNAPLWSLAYEVWLYCLGPLLFARRFFIRVITWAFCLAVFAYFDYFSLAAAFGLGYLLAFWRLRWPLRLRFLPIVGRHSYEIYVFHYPVLIALGMFV